MTRLLALCLATLLAACSNQPPVTSNPYVATALTQVTTLAMAPGGGALAEEVALLLETRHGFTVLGAPTTTLLMQQGGVTSLDSRTLGGLGFLERQAVDAVIRVSEGTGDQASGAMVTALRVPDGVRIAETRYTPRIAPQRWRGALDGHVADLLATGLAEALNR